VQPRPFVARSERLTTAIDVPQRPASDPEAGGAAPGGGPSSADGSAEKPPSAGGDRPPAPRPDRPERAPSSSKSAPADGSSPPPAPSPSGNKAEPGSGPASSGDAPKPASGGRASTAERPDVPWPHSGSEAASEPTGEPRADGSASSDDAPRLKSNDVTRPFTPGPESTGSGGSNGSTSDPAPKKGAHALHTGAYPVVSESASMRPRNEPPPEPAELFRPAARTETRPTPETTVKVPAVKPANGADGRSLAPVPPGADKPDGSR